jgi:hypothetical protein
VTAVHFAFLAGVVLARITRWCSSACSCCSSASPPGLRAAPAAADDREALLVAFFLAGLVVLGGMQQWWLQPLVRGWSPHALFFGALGSPASPTTRR